VAKAKSSKGKASGKRGSTKAASGRKTAAKRAGKSSQKVRDGSGRFAGHM
jgi:hypothetical protein